MTRRQLVVVVLAVAAFAVFGPALFRRPALAGIDPGEIRAVEVRFRPWDDKPAAAGATTTDSEAAAALAKLLRSGVETQDHKCADRGTIVLRRPPGEPVEVRFLPGHHPEWYEFRYGDKAYRVPRAAFVEAMRRVGVEVPLSCQ